MDSEDGDTGCPHAAVVVYCSERKRRAAGCLYAGHQSADDLGNLYGDCNSLCVVAGREDKQFRGTRQDGCVPCTGRLCSGNGNCAGGDSGYERAWRHAERMD